MSGSNESPTVSDSTIQGAVTPGTNPAYDQAQLDAAAKPSVGLGGLGDALTRGGVLFGDRTGFDTTDLAPGERLTIRYGYLEEPTWDFDLVIPKSANWSSGFVQLTNEQIDAFEMATRVWEQFIYVDFVRVEGENASPGFLTGNESGYQLGIGGFTEGSFFAFTTWPGDGDVADYDQEIWLRWTDPAFSGAGLAFGGKGFETMLHELGHVLGLQHPGDYNATDLDAPTYNDDAEFREDNRALTLMSYFSEYYGGADFKGVFPSTPMPADIGRLAQIYAPPIEGFNDDGNTVYGVGAVGGSPLRISSSTDKIVGTIYDFSGDNWLNVSSYSEDATIDLTQMLQSVGGLTNNIAILGIVTQISTGSGFDTITGSALNETLDGGAGDDSIRGGDGDDVLHGGLGRDTVLGEDGFDRLHGEPGNDSLDGGNRADWLWGDDGADTLVAGGQVFYHDSVFGGQGNDLVLVHGGGDYLAGGAGIDTISFADLGIAPGQTGVAMDLAAENMGSGLIDGFNPFTRLEENGDALAMPVLEFEVFIGSQGDDTLRGDDNDNWLWANEGDDLISGRGGADRLLGEAGLDSIDGGAGNDTLLGGDGNDLLNGGDDNDQLNGDEGADLMLGGDGNDALYGGSGTGADVMYGGLGDDAIDGQAGDDELHGGGGADSLSGGAGADRVYISGAGAAYAGAYGTSEGEAGDILDLRELPGLVPGLTGVTLYLSDGIVQLDGTALLVATHGFHQVQGSELGERFVLDSNAVSHVYAGGGNDNVYMRNVDGSSADGGDGRDLLTLIFDNDTNLRDVDLVAGRVLWSHQGLSQIVSISSFEDVEASGRNFSIYGDDGANRLTGTGTAANDGGDRILDGRGGDDTLVLLGAGEIEARGGDGNDTILANILAGNVDGGADNDTLDFSTPIELFALSVDLSTGEAGTGAGLATLTHAFTVANVENVIGSAGWKNLLVGDAGANLLQGGTAADTLTGGAGNDTLTGGGGFDSLVGGAGDDRLELGSASDASIGDADGGDDVDLLVLHGLTSASFTLATDTHVLSSKGLVFFENIERVDFTADVTLTTGLHWIGGTLADTLTGALGDDTLEGLGGNDLLVGGDGDDLFLLSVDSGLDTVDGGTGNDTLVLDLSGSGVGVTLNLAGSGVGGFLPPGGFPPPGGGFPPPGGVPPAPGGPGGGPVAPAALAMPTMTSIEQVLVKLGDGNDSVIGSTGADSVEAGGGNDTVSSAAGADVVHGGEGDDSIVDQGSGDADWLLGEGGNDYIASGGGADLVDGGEGNDTLVNQALFFPGFTNPVLEHDILAGGAGNDSITSTAPGTFDGGTGTDWLTLDFRQLAGVASAGLDLNLTDPEATVELPAGSSATGFERYSLHFASGDDSVSVTNAAHVLDGDSGDDTLRIVLGAEEAAPTMTVEESPFGFGPTTLVFSSGLRATGFEHIEIAQVIGGQLQTAQSFSVPMGTSGDDTLLGSATKDLLLGLGGNDSLVGNGGADTLVGGTGNDTYVVEDAAAQVVELADAGVDVVQTSLASYTLGDNVETLQFIGSGDFSGTGNALANSLSGGAGHDTLVGGGGNDTFVGGGGDDSLVGGAGDDSFDPGSGSNVVLGNGGSDTVVLHTTLAQASFALNLDGSWTVTTPDGSNQLSGIGTLQFDDASGTLGPEGFVAALCFYPGTLVATPQGERRVESLAIGDLVLTHDGQVRPVRWMGRQTISTRFADPLRVLPIRLRAGALGDGLPRRDLLVSPDHALLVDGILVQAGALVNGVGIVREAAVPERFTYHHVELADHSLVLAEGVPAETFVDNVERLAFDNWAEHEALYGHLPTIAEMDLPRAKAARQVPRWLRARLAA